MKIFVDTSTLVAGSICWEYQLRGKDRTLKQRAYFMCNGLFRKIKEKKCESDTIISKTVEDETRGVLRKAVNNTIIKHAPRDLLKKYKLMVLQEIVLNDSLDKLDYYVEECSIRLPIDTDIRDEIKINEIEPFLKRTIINTVRFLRPSKIPRFVKGSSFRRELNKIMAKSLPQSGVVYKGMPEDRDLILMSEATFIIRTYFPDEDVYIVSLDNHFKPNPVIIYLSESRTTEFIGKFDSTIRDTLHSEFGFIGEYPKVMTQIIDKL